MKSKVLMATLVVTLLMGAQSFAGNCCDPCDAACGPCDVACCGKPVDLFAGLKKLVACNPCSPNECGPCDSVVACTPCDSACDPCEAACGPKFVFGKRFRELFAGNGCNPCDAGCDPCEAACGACDGCDVGCDVGCGPCFSLKGFFKGFRLAGRCDTGCCDPCEAACGACDANCCDPCEAACGACDGCDVGCDVGCGPCFQFGKVFDAPRRNMKRFFDSFRIRGCNPCDPACGPCDVACDPCSSCCN